MSKSNIDMMVANIILLSIKIIPHKFEPYRIMDFMATGYSGFSKLSPVFLSHGLIFLGNYVYAKRFGGHDY